MITAERWTAANYRFISQLAALNRARQLVRLSPVGGEDSPELGFVH